MGIEDAKVARPGVWRWDGIAGVPGVYRLVSPSGSHVGSWWPETEPPPELFGMLTQVAEDLQALEPAGLCQCGGDVLMGGQCSSCRAEHAPEVDR